MFHQSKWSCCFAREIQHPNNGVTSNVLSFIFAVVWCIIFVLKKDVYESWSSTINNHASEKNPNVFTQLSRAEKCTDPWTISWYNSLQRLYLLFKTFVTTAITFVYHHIFLAATKQLIPRSHTRIFLRIPYGSPNRSQSQASVNNTLRSVYNSSQLGDICNEPWKQRQIFWLVKNILTIAHGLIFS